LSLRSRRRIFARKKRRPLASVTVRSCAVLAAGFTAAFAASVLAEKHFVFAAPAERFLPALSDDLALMRADEPVMRLAAAGLPHGHGSRPRIQP
jgi:hypothetical protein